MIAQYTQAAIVSELKRLAAPAIVDSIPSQRDAGGPRLDGLVAPRASCAARSTGCAGCSRSSCSPPPAALDLRAPLAARPGHRRPCATPPRRDVAGPGPDRYLAPEIEAAVEFVRSGAALAAAESVIGPLSLSSETEGAPHGRRPSRARRTRHHPDRPSLADRGAAADAA